MAFGSIILLAGSGSSSSGGLDLVISANTTDYNALTAATAAGYDNSTGNETTVTVTINSGVNVTASGSGLTAFTTGAFNANTTLTIINNGNIQGANGGTGSNGGNGGEGGKGIFFNTLTGGSATHSLENNGTVSGGGGGGGSGGHRRTGYNDGDGGVDCFNPTVIGGAGAVGGLGEDGQAGENPPIQGLDCPLSPPRGLGGAGGDSIDKNGRTVAQSGSGTYNGTQRA